jgi:hypothetical protein
MASHLKTKPRRIATAGFDIQGSVSVAGEQPLDLGQ